jgi:ABC-2 type transport system permease protein
MSLKKQLFTVLIFTKINSRRFFRDRLAIFFTIIFPLIFLFIFGSLFGKNNTVNFKVALINQSKTEFSTQFVKNLENNKIFKVSKDLTSLDQAKEKMNRGEIDAAIVLPGSFGIQPADTGYPSGQAEVYYSQNSSQAGTSLVAVLDGVMKGINTQFIQTPVPFTVKGMQTNDRGLSSFDYTFSGLLGFSILGIGIFGPMNVFPELKKQGILRRLHTTTIRVWQYFMSTMISQALIGLLSFAIQFAVAIAVFHLNVVGNYFELVFFLLLGTVMILGIGLSLGGWAKNERQVAPLGNLITFPMIFLSGAFFPRFLMPEWLQKISTFLPLTPVIDGVRLIATEGKHLTDIGAQLGLIGIWLVVIYFVAFRVFRWE